ncbi:MAG: histidine kinase [Candidatus Delongbacteria bacterium]|nr:histidine kinase [Candidatus Delongbacteria bacterium]
MINLRSSDFHFKHFIFVLAIISHFSPLTLFSQTYGYKVFGAKDGLVSNQIWNIGQDSAGYLWLASVEGCSRFDGRESINFTKYNGLTTTQVWDFAFHHDTVFLLLNNHVNIIVDLKVYEWPLKEKLVYRSHRFITIDGNPTIWATRENGQDILFDIKKQKHLSGFDSILNIDKSSYGLFYNIKNRLFLHEVYNEQTQTEYYYEIYRGLNGVYTAAFDSKNKMVKPIIPNNHKIGIRCFYFHENDIIDKPDEFFLFESEISLNLKISEGFNVYNTEGKLKIFKDGEIIDTDMAFGAVHAFYMASNSNVWIATDGGLIHLYNDGIINYPVEKGYLKLSWSIFPKSLNDIWLGAFDSGLHHYVDGESFENITEKYNGYILSPYNGSTKGFKNDMVIPTGNKGLFVYDFDTKRYRLIPCSPKNDTYFVWKDTIANRILTGRDVVYYLNSDYTLDSIFQINKRPNLQRVNAVARRDSFYYFSSGNNLLEYNMNSGTQRWLGFQNVRFNSISMDRWRNLWAASDIGIYYLNPNDTISWMKDQHFWALKIDKKNRLFAVSKNGLYLMDLNRFYQTGKAVFVHFGEEEGFAGAGDQDAFFLDDDNKMWLPGTSNNVRIDADKLNLEPERLGTVLSRSIAYYDTTKIDIRDYAGKKIDYFFRDLSFNFHTICFNSPSKVRYQYRLVGYDREWSRPTVERQVRYTNIPPGEYSFQVRAALYGDFEEAEITKIDFEINSPFWQDWWFKMIALFIVLSIISLIAYHRIKKIRKTFEQEQKLRHLEMEVLQMQIRPHFIGNSLELIKGFIFEGNTKKSIDAINSFGKLIRDVTQNINQPYITLKEEIAIISNYLEFQKIRFSDGFEYCFDVPDKSVLTSTYIPPLLLQPFVENAIIHGFKGIKHQGKIEIKIINDVKYLVVEIKDNGVGIQSNSLLKTNGHHSVGVENSISRLKIFNQRINSENPIQIKSLDQGTLIQLKINKI